EPREVGGLLRLAAEQVDVRGAQAVVGRHRQRDRRVDARQLFDADAVVHRGHRRAAVLRVELDPHHAQPGKLAQKGGRELLRLLLTAAQEAADITGVLGRTTTPVGRPAKGLAIGTGLLIVGFEFEYAATDEDLTAPAGAANVAPALKTFMFNGLLQTPVPIAR